MPRDESLHFAHFLLDSGWAANVRIRHVDGLCSTIETDAPPTAGDERHELGIPGIANLHSHAFQRGMAGMAERRGPVNDSFWTWRELMYRFVDRLSPDDVRAIAAMAYVEMLETGFTRVGEFHYLHHDRDGMAYQNPAAMSDAIMQAARDTGIALTHLPVFYAHSGFGGAAPGAGQKRFINDIDGFSRLVDGIRASARNLPDAVIGMAPHSLRAVTGDELAALLPLADGGPIHIHIAEQTREVQDCIAWSGARPVEWLLHHAPVDERWCLVHATHMTDAEAEDMARRGAIAGLCPITEANLGDGFFNIDPFRANDGRFGIGSDSNILIDASEELRLLEYGLRLLKRGRNIFTRSPGDSTGRVIFEEAARGGAGALGVEWGLSIGTPVDILSFNSEHPALFARTGDDILASWIFGGGRSTIDSVWRRGRKVVSRGRHHRRDDIETQFRATLGKLL